ncbi:MAG: hypothetical protein GY845_24885 [Planctomycetes bacterium]|nr:hypothetical protein [Planctomycetota bacterium]
MIKKKTIVIILSTVLVTALVMMIVFWLWLEIYMTYSTIVSVSASYRVTVPGKPAVSARLYWQGSPHIGGSKNLLVLKSKSSGRREFYCIDIGRREIGLPPCPKYVPLLFGAIVDRSTLGGFPLLGELEAEWNKNDHEVRMRIMGFSDAAIKADGGPGPDDNEIARRNMPIGYQRDVIFTGKSHR